MAFFDYNRDGKKDWKDNAREYGIITIDRISKEKSKRSLARYYGSSGNKR